MTTEQLLRDRLTRMTADVPVGPDLATSIRAGRRRRRTAHAGLALGVAAVVATAALAANGLGGDDAPAVVAREAPPTDWVAGTGTDEALAAAVAEHLPALPAPDDVYPSATDAKGPIPDAEFARATDWQAAYGDVLVITATAAEPFDCPDCTSEAVPGGTLVTQTYDSGDLTWHGTWLERPDGSSSGVLEGVAPGGPATLAPAAVAALLQDPRLVLSGA